MAAPTPYQRLAERLDALPNGFPATSTGAELRLLAKLFSPEEAALAAQLRLTLETPEALAARTGHPPAELRRQLKAMARRGLIATGRAGAGLGYGLLPFVVGIYEMQLATIDAELARLFEDYFQQAFGQALAHTPALQRIVPVNASVPVTLAIEPYESVAALVAGAQAWGVTDCICRRQKALLGAGCTHPVEVCLVLSPTPGAFDHSSGLRALTRAEALAVLQTAAQAGLVHSVSNTQQGVGYICNCCTCACGILRGLAELGLAQAVARSSFVCTVAADQCSACGACAPRCPFGALTAAMPPAVLAHRCLGCGVCISTCPADALRLARRPAEEISPPPATATDWRAARAAARGIDLQTVA